MAKIKVREKIKERSIQAADFFRTNWKELLLVGGLITTAVFLSSEDSDDENSNDDVDNLYKGGVNDMKFSSKWFSNATDDELESEREKVRERYVDGTIDIDEADKLYDTLHRFDSEMIDRANSKYEKEHPDAKPRHREHGWYLSNDD